MAARQALEDMCAQRGWDAPVYMNMHRDAHPGNQPTTWWAWAEPRNSPFFRTLRCRDADARGSCRRGDWCVFAHSEAELRPKPPRATADDPAFLFEVAVRADHATVRARADAPSTQKRKARTRPRASCWASSSTGMAPSMARRTRARPRPPARARRGRGRAARRPCHRAWWSQRRPHGISPTTSSTSSRTC